MFSRVTSEMTVLQLQTEDGIRTLRLTPEHPAYVDTMGWVQAGMVAPGDEILDYDGNTPLTVISNVREETTERVYNFEVEGTHNYFAGDVGAWVHNGFGAYVFQNGAGAYYVGKGDASRARTSYNRLGGVGDILEYPACSDRASFILEDELIEGLGGIGELLNKINSPGKKLRGR